MKINGYELNLSEEKLEHIFERETIDIKLVSKNFAGYESLKSGDKEALEHLVKAAKIMNDVSLEQDHHLNRIMKRALEAESTAYAAKALKLFNSLNGVEGTNGIDKKPVEIFKGISGYKGRNFYPHDLSDKEFCSILKVMLEDGKIEEVKNILSARTMVRRDDDKLKAIDYTEYFKEEFSEIAKELEAAARLATNQSFADYLKFQAQALTKNDNNLDAKADTAWAKLQDTDLEFTISRENYEDSLTPCVFDDAQLMSLIEKHKVEVNSKDMLGIRVGIVNKDGTDLILNFKSKMCDLAKLMPFCDQYEQSVTCDDFNQTMVDADIVYLSGDYAQCRGGITTAQNLPNNDKLSVKQGGGRRNVYHRQVRQSGDAEREQKLLNALIDKDLHHYYNHEADHLFVIGHENGHSFGPDSSYQLAMGVYKHVIEELKADIISLAFMPEYVKAGIISKEQLKEVYLSQIAMRSLLKAEPQMATPHRIADLIIFNFLLEKGAVFLKDNKVSLNFPKMEVACSMLLAETIKVQLSKSPTIAKTFVDKHAVWGNISERIAQEQRKLGLKPYKHIKTEF